jgi:membrane-bound metal-dependent hydrolase YbcI (DUF457 family)
VIVGGVLIDVDHLIEYFLDTGLNGHVRRFFVYSQKAEFTRYILLFHSFEFVFICGLVGFCRGSFSIWMGLAMGLLSHILLDYINIITRLGFKPRAILLFLFVYRLRYWFNRQTIDVRVKKNIF